MHAGGKCLLVIIHWAKYNMKKTEAVAVSADIGISSACNFS